MNQKKRGHLLVIYDKVLEQLRVEVRKVCKRLDLVTVLDRALFAVASPR